MKMPGIRQHFLGLKSLNTVLDSLTEAESDELGQNVLGTVADNSRTRENGPELNLVLSEELGVKLFGVIVRDAVTATRQDSLPS